MWLLTPLINHHSIYCRSSYWRTIERWTRSNLAPRIPTFISALSSLPYFTTQIKKSRWRSFLKSSKLFPRPFRTKKAETKFDPPIFALRFGCGTGSNFTYHPKTRIRVWIPLWKFQFRIFIIMWDKMKRVFFLFIGINLIRLLSFHYRRLE